MSYNDHNITERLDLLARVQAENSRVLATLESRILIIHDEVRRSAETIARLKLTADNFKKLAVSQNETIRMILARLDGAAR